jgi:hypothetical protein
MRTRLKLWPATVLLVLLAASTLHAKPRPSDTALAIRAVASAAGVCHAIETAGPLSPALLAADGVTVWSQPGVALVPELRYRGGGRLPAQLTAGNGDGMLKRLPYYTWSEPTFSPTEQQAASGNLPKPGVYLLPAGRASARMQRHVTGYQEWLRMNDGELTYPKLQNDAAKCDFAVVYLDESGAFELYYTLDGNNALRLKHVVIREFFSA